MKYRTTIAGSIFSTLAFIACSGATPTEFFETPPLVVSDAQPQVDASVDAIDASDSSPAVDSAPPCDYKSDEQICIITGKDCGVYPTTLCGVSRTPNCGMCAAGYDCSANKCVCAPVVCAPHSCGQVSNGCGSSSDCGTCNANEVCTANVCTQVPLIDHHGPVMPIVNLYVIYWGTGFSATTPALYTSFLTGIGASPYTTINTQYLRGATNVITYKASFADTVTPIAASIVDADLHAEIDRVIAAGHLTYDANGIYFVITPKTTQVCSAPGSCSCSQFCGYHFFYADSLARTVVYASIPSAAACPASCGTVFTTDAAAPNGNVEADEGVSVLAHELMEAQSDTLINAWSDASGKENADKCAYQYGVALGIKTNQTWGGKSWLVQQNWSNAASACKSN